MGVQEGDRDEASVIPFTRERGGLASKKFMPDFQRWIDYLDEQGYRTFWKKINAKDFGVPQNRVRVFALSIRKDASAKFPQLFPSGIKYDFPQPFPLERRLRDILVTYHDGESVEDRYYLKTDVILGRLKWNAETTTNHKFEYTEGGA
jgi:DNA (cytosine-5)-methyltransferase 1